MGAASRYEVAIIGCGIAGASLAYFLGRRGCGSVVVLEREGQPGAHATGRSAAVLVPVDAHPVVQGLKATSIPFIAGPPAGFADGPLLVPTGILVLHSGSSWTRARESVAGLAGMGIRVRALTGSEAAGLVPALVPGSFDGALHFPGDGALDVHAMLMGYIGGARRAGAQIRCGVEVTAISTRAGRCTGVMTSAGEIRASRVVDASGAWAGLVSRQAGASPVTMTPLRRSVITYAPPPGLCTRPWPFVKSESHQVYLKHESGSLLMSPMDEGPAPDRDPAPDDLAIAEGVERLRALAPAAVPAAVTRRWAGLRTFTGDGLPVVGEDPALAGLHWLAGQGGYGIVTSPVLGRIAADLVLDGGTDVIDPGTLSPSRLV